MSQYFDRLEAELRAAVPRAATEHSATARSAHGRRRARAPRRGTVGIALAVAVCVGVVVVAVALLGHRRAAPGPRRAAAPPAARVATPPTLAQLKANFAILRRPQTAADRAWGPGHATQLIASLTRLDRRLPGGQRVFLTVDRGPAHALWLWIVGPGADRVGTPFSAGNGYAVLPLGTPAPGRRITRWTSIVPDGVDRVRWTFACRVQCASIQRFVPVLGNVATAPIAGTEPCTDPQCRTAIRTDWFVGESLAMSFDRATTAHMIAPPFVEPFLAGPRDKRVTDSVVLRADGLSTVRFGASPAGLERLVEPSLGRPVASGSPRGDCGVDRTLVWPLVIDAATGHVQLSVGLSAFFYRDRLVGYQYGSALAAGAARTRTLLAGATDRGLRLGDTIARSRQLYGAAFHTSYAQGGTWWVGSAHRGLRGYAAGNPPAHTDIGPHSEITSIDAGNVGCPAVSP